MMTSAQGEPSSVSSSSRTLCWLSGTNKSPRRATGRAFMQAVSRRAHRAALSTLLRSPLLPVAVDAQQVAGLRRGLLG